MLTIFLDSLTAGHLVIRLPSVLICLEWEIGFDFPEGTISVAMTSKNFLVWYLGYLRVEAARYSVLVRFLAIGRRNQFALLANLPGMDGPIGTARKQEPISVAEALQIQKRLSQFGCSHAYSLLF